MKNDRGRGFFFWRLPTDKLVKLKWRREDSITREGVSRVTDTERKEGKEI